MIRIRDTMPCKYCNKEVSKTNIQKHYLSIKCKEKQTQLKNNNKPEEEQIVNDSNSSSCTTSEDDEILQLLNKNCNENEKEMFIKNYNLYQIYKNNKDDCVIDLDNIWQWLGFTRKDNAKRRLIDKFKENIDYVIIKKYDSLLRSEESSKSEKYEQILMKINTFKKFCMVASTTKSTEIYDYYIKMEDVINNYNNKQANISNNGELLNDDRLLQLLNENFNDDEQQLFINQFKIFLEHGDDETKYIIDLDNIWQWLGFAEKRNAKTLLLNNFNKYEDYRLFVFKDEKSFGRPKEQILMNVNTFKELCTLASTDKAKQIRKYYIKMESVYNKYLKEKLTVYNNITNEYNKIIQDKDNKLIEYNNITQDKDKIIQEKNNQIAQLQLTNTQFNEKKKVKYEEVEKTEYVYVFSTDKPNAYKIGKSKNPDIRKKSLQTGQIDDINILYKFKTYDTSPLEGCVHNILDEHRCKCKREYFDCTLDHIINMINILGTIINTLKSCNDGIELNGIIEEINKKLSIMNINNINFNT